MQPYVALSDDVRDRGGECDEPHYQEAEPARERDDHGHERRRHPDELEPRLEPGECPTAHVVERVALHDGVERQFARGRGRTNGAREHRSRSMPLDVKLADESVCIGPAPARESYLNIPRIISAAEITDSATTAI